LNLASLSSLPPSLQAPGGLFELPLENIDEAWKLTYMYTICVIYVYMYVYIIYIHI